VLGFASRVRALASARAGAGLASRCGVLGFSSHVRALASLAVRGARLRLALVRGRSLRSRSAVGARVLPWVGARVWRSSVRY
jgi:hypothetical protein